MAAQRGSPRAASYFHISDNLYIKFDNNDKRELREPVAKFDIIPDNLQEHIYFESLRLTWRAD